MRLLVVLLLFATNKQSLSAMMPRTSSKLSLRVVSYNVLSTHLARPSHFTTLNPEHLEASNRLPIVLKKLEDEISVHKNVIVCLQEVSYDWAGAFSTFFASKGFHLVTCNYGKKFNGYMGVCLAWPTAQFEAVNVDICRLSDTRTEWPEPPQLNPIARLWSSVIAPPLQKLGMVKETEDHWSVSERRFNALVSATLKERESGEVFAIGVYHMPCVFYIPMVMSIHADMAAKHMQEMAATQGGIPYILAGDFNIKPSDSCYKLLTTGKMDPQDPFYPTPKNGVEWSPSIEAMKSAYAESMGAEPDFTNYARIQDDDPFIDTIDYIFLSPSWKVAEVRKLPKIEEAGGPFPNLDVGEPSDHVVIAANVELED